MLFQQVQFEVSDATKRDFPPERFDAVYSRETILHIKDKKALFEKILVSVHYFMLFILVH